MKKLCIAILCVFVVNVVALQPAFGQADPATRCLGCMDDVDQPAGGCLCMDYADPPAVESGFGV